MTQTTELIMTENTVSQIYRATYSPDDNKLRLYASLRLDEETYSLINKAGFRWAPKQELFVAPAWTPGREDVLLSLAGDIEDEDSTLFDRQEQRAGRFSDYSDRRAVESEQALAHVDSLASAVPLGPNTGNSARRPLCGTRNTRSVRMCVTAVSKKSRRNYASPKSTLPGLKSI
ncbi:hypothetical protein [Veillonella sp.]|uniref:hypothetical protein n=1 Tax=Veillonella sp. TaxID=1926307 RepID=UPI003A5C1951